MKQKLIGPLLVLLVFLVLDLVFIYTENPARVFSKSMLMPILGWMYVRAVGISGTATKLLLSGLLFSWLGDILLLYDKDQPVFFIIGLSAFLITHILYIIYFIRISSTSTSFLQKRPVMLLALMAYTFELLYILWPGLNGMKLPVTIYALIISTMLATAAWQYEKIPSQPAWLFIIGALLFVISDSILAINKFHSPFAGGGITVMTTYVAAQACIVVGSIHHLTGATEDGIV